MSAYHSIEKSNPNDFTWNSWETGTFRKGDVLSIEWTYDGLHGPLYHKEVVLLLKLIPSANNEEVWSAIVFGETGMRDEEFHVTDLKAENDKRDESNITDLWQKITLISRIECETQP